jgi:hypothetical protein
LHNPYFFKEDRPFLVWQKMSGFSKVSIPQFLNSQ